MAGKRSRAQLLRTRAWGVEREWTKMCTSIPSNPYYVLVGRPLVRFEEQGRTPEELEAFYPNPIKEVT